MQKLVYDNYNKFITATETIKEMKNDVHAMDGDMEAVRQKMENIITSTKKLDDLMFDKRNQVSVELFYRVITLTLFLFC